MVTNNQESQYLLQLETTSKQVASTSSTNRRYQSTSNSSSNKNGMNGTGTHHRPFTEDNDDYYDYDNDEVESEQDPNNWILRQQQLQQQQQQQQHDHPYNAAYEILEKANLLERNFLKESFSDISQEGDLDPNSTLADNFTKKWQWGVYWTPGCGWMLYKIFHKEIIVPPGHIVCLTDQHNHHIFAKPGIHNIQNPFLQQRGGPIALVGSQNHRNIIEHGNRCVLIVPQGMIGYATNMGRHPILLPPGLHSWTSDTLRLERMYRLDDGGMMMPVLQMGPYTILTVEEGMVAITVNHGRQVLLEGGKTHLLTHSRWKLERFVSVKVQSEDLRQVNVATADNIVMNVDATCVWRIVDVEKAAIMIGTESSSSSSMMRSDLSIGTMTEDGNGGGGGGGGTGLSKLRRDVLKQTVSAIARFVSEVNYSEYFHAVSSAMRMEIVNTGSDDDHHVDGEMKDDNVKKGRVSTSGQIIENPMFHHERLQRCVADANKITNELGVEIVNVSIIAASPANATLMNSLSTSAIAMAEALQAETHARGMARTMEIEARATATASQIESEAEAKALLTKAKADAEAEVVRSQGTKEAELLRAQGVKEAAKLIESSQLAVTLETIKASAMAIKDSDKFYFGQHPDYLSKLMKTE